METPFKAVFTKKCNFLTQSFDTEPININYGSSGKIMVPRHGDFITKMYLLIDYTSTQSTRLNQAHAMIDYVSLNIGGNTIQQESGETLNLRLNVENTEKESFSIVQLYRMLGGGPGFPFTDTDQFPRTYRLQVPLKFWFHGKINLAIPLCALRLHEVEVDVGLRDAQRWGGVDSGNNNVNVSLRIEYGYAPKEIVDSLSKKQLIYPVEQFQYSENEYTGDSVFILKPYINNPVKALFFTFKNTSTETTTPFDYSRELQTYEETTLDYNDFLNSLEIKLDDNLILQREVGTFQMLRGFQYYSHFPGSNQNILFGEDTYRGYIYALALCKDPMNIPKPNGSINFSQVTNPYFRIDAKGKNTDTIKFKIFPLSINLLYIEKGVSKLVFDNTGMNLPTYH